MHCKLALLIIMTHFVSQASTCSHLPTKFCFKIKISAPWSVEKYKPDRSLRPCLQEHKFFDSADWALSKQGVKSEQQQIPAASHLEPKLTPSDHQPARRASHLGEEG